MRCIKALALLLILWPWLASAQTADSWIRIDRPDAELRAALPPEAIDYGSFVWMPAVLAPRSLELGQVHRIERPFDLRVHGLSVDPLEGLPGADRPGRAAFSGEADFHLVQFRGPIRREWLEDLNRRGLQPVQYMAPFIYIVWGRADQLPVPGTRSDEPVRFAGVLPPAMRFAPDEPSARGESGASLAMIYRPDENRILADIAALGIEVLSVSGMERDFRIAAIQAGPDRHAELAQIPGVLTLQAAEFEPHPRGEMSGQSVVGAIGENNVIFPGYPAWLEAAGVSGEGVLVSVVDEGIRQTHEDLRGRFVTCISTGTGEVSSCGAGAYSSDHASHVAGAIAGTGASNRTLNGFLRGLGIAPGAFLVNQVWTPFIQSNDGGNITLVENGMETIFREAALSEAVLANFSWGLQRVPRGYDIATRTVDMLIRDAIPDLEGNQALAAIWAINNRLGDRDFGQCRPSNLGSPEEAKNLIAVGGTNLLGPTGIQLGNALMNLYRNEGSGITQGTSHGPACDGRLVPQIVAPACFTDGLRGQFDADHGLRCGNSMAAPLVTGAAALFVEQYRREHDGQNPSPALIRAMLTISAQDLVGNRDADLGILSHRPDRKQGWGRLDLDAVINRPRSVLIDQSHVFRNSGEIWQLRVAPQDPALPVRVMLAWTDAPGAAIDGVNTNPALVNDLDLRVRVGENLYLGNRFGVDGFSASGGASDGLNNMEAVVLSAAQHDWQEIEIEVVAFNVSADALDPWNPGPASQDFALVCYNCRTEPDFSLRVEPSPVTVCLDEDGDGLAEASLQADALLGFFGDIDLGAIDIQPDDSGVEATASPTDLRPGASATLSVGASGASDRDDVRLLVQAVASGQPESTRQLLVPLILLSGVDATVDLIGPPDQAAAWNLLPKFSWEEAERAQRYRFELATASDFAEASIVAQETVATNEWQLLQRLNGKTDYFWRVFAINDCGAEVVSETWEFSTGSNTPARLRLSFNTPDQTLPSGSALPQVVVDEVFDVEDQLADGVAVRLELRALIGDGRLEGELVRETEAGSVVFDDLFIQSDFGGSFELLATIVRDEALPVPDEFLLSGGQSTSRAIAGGLTRGGPFKGLRFSGEKTGIVQGNLSQPFASDLRMDLTSPDGQHFSVGGADEKNTAADWDFQDQSVVTDGLFSSEHPDAYPSDTPIVGLWTVRFTHDNRARSPMRWEDVRLILLKDALQATTESFNVEGRLIFRDRFQPESP